MPVAVEPDPAVLAGLVAALPPGGQGVASVAGLHPWLRAHGEEYVVVLGPGLALTDALALCEELRTTAPAVSLVLARDRTASTDGDLLARALRAGVRDVVDHQDRGALEEAVARARQLWTALRGTTADGAAREARVVTVFSPKGGVGKTTVAVNLALALAGQGAHRVCLVDLDLAFGDVAITMQMFPTHSIEQAIGSEDSLDAEMLSGLLTRHQDSLMVLAAPPHPDTRERVSPLLVSRILRTLRTTFDFVVVDLAPAFDELSLTALDETDEIVLVASLDVPTLKNLKVALETLDTLDLAPEGRRLVLNRADDRVGIEPAKVEGILGLPVDVQVASSLDVATATNAGTPLVQSNPGHQLSRAMRTLAGLVGGGTSDVPADPAATGPAGLALGLRGSTTGGPGRELRLALRRRRTAS